MKEAGKYYGEGIIKNYSIKLIKEEDKKYNTTNLKRMRQFYILIEKGATVSHQLTWSHYIELVPIKNIDEVNYYINKMIINNIGIRQLREKVKSKEYERLPIETRNKLINKEKTNIKELVPNPIMIKNKNDIEVSTEKALHHLILEDNIKKL